MTRDPDRTHTLVPIPTDDPAFDAGLAVAFGAESTPGGWTHPPLLRDDPSDNAPLVQPSSPEALRAAADRYQFLGEIARGGMGVILKGRDPDLGRDVAVKVLKAELADRASAAQRFVEEAQVCGQLQHPGVVPVYDLARFADGRPYFAMKLVKGQTLAEMLTDRVDLAAKRGDFLQTFLQVCHTMAYAHAKGVIHRDLKPANVMVGSFGEVLVMDWGLAKVLPRGGVADEERATHASRDRERPEPTVIYTARSGTGMGSDTAAGSVMGTPAFMPPEQAGGEVEKLDERTDVFGLGAILCVILTGNPPYVGSDSDAVRLMAIRGQLDDAFSRLDACGADAELISLCKQCLAADRDARPRHAGVLRDALRDHLADVESRAQRAEVAWAAAEAKAVEEANTRRVAEQKVAEEHKRRRVQLALAASVGLLLVGAGSFAWFLDRQGADRRAQTARNADALADLVSRCEDGLRREDSDGAGAALAEIDRRLGEGGADAVKAQVDRCRSDLAVLRDLDEFDQFRWTPIRGDRPPLTEEVRRLRLVLERFGVVPGRTPLDEAAGRVSQSKVRDRLVAALDRWLRLEQLESVRSAQAGSVRPLLAAVDPDPYRDAVRDVVHGGGGAVRMRELAAQAEALRQPPGFAAFLGGSPAIPVERKRELLVAALRRWPNNFGLLMTIGMTYPDSQREGAEERTRWFQAAVAARPTNSAAQVHLGLSLRYKGDVDGAIECFKEAIRLDPKDAAAHLDLGALLCDVRHDYDAAVACFQDSLRIHPNDAKAHSNLGIALSHKGDLDGAIASYKECIRLDPELAPVRRYLGHALKGKGDLDGAIGEYREAIRLDPKAVDSRTDLGNALKAKGDLDGAIGEYREAIQLDPKNAASHSHLGVALRSKRDADGAIASFREAIRLDPNDSRAHFGLGGILCDVKGDYDGAAASFREAVRLNPKDSLTHSNLGIALYHKGDVDGAVAAFKEAVRLDPKDVRGHHGLGLFLSEVKGDLDGAIACFKEAIRLEPQSAIGHHSLARVLGAKGDLDGAVASCKEAIRLDPKHYPTHHNLGVFLQAKRGTRPGPWPPTKRQSASTRRWPNRTILWHKSWRPGRTACATASARWTTRP